MPERKGREGPKFMMVRDEVERVMKSLDKDTLKKVEKHLEKLDIDMDYCIEHPDLFCAILKIVCGKSYVELIRSGTWTFLD